MNNKTLLLTIMFQLLTQLFLAVTGGYSLPEEVFDVLFPLLQGKRKRRENITLDITDYSKMTPFQILLYDIPCQEYQTWEQFQGLRKKINSKRWTKLYYLDSEKKKCRPLWHSRRIWKDRTYTNEMVRINYILYMKNEEEKNVVLRNMNRLNNSFVRGVDISWMSSCVFCGDFMKIRSYSLKNQKKNVNDICEQINRLGYNYGATFEEPVKRNLKSVPICNLCEKSKDRQGLYRMNMLSRGDWGETFYHERSEEYHRSLGRMYQKPDMSDIPSNIKLHWETPLDYSPFLYWNMTDPLSDYFWHPELSADEYMRLMEVRSRTFIDDPDPLDDELYGQFDDNPEYAVEDILEGVIQVIENGEE